MSDQLGQANQQLAPSSLDAIEDPNRFVDETRQMMSYLSRQEQRFVFYYMKGNSPGKSAVAAGFQAKKGKALLLDNRIVNALEAYAGREMEEAKVTKDSLTQLTMEAHSNSVNATEQLQAIDRLARLHGLFDTQKAHPTVQINQQINGGAVMNAEAGSTMTSRLKSVDDATLLEASGFELDDLVPSGKKRKYVSEVRGSNLPPERVEPQGRQTVDGEFEEVLDRPEGETTVDE